MNVFLSCSAQLGRQLFAIGIIAFTLFLLVRAAPGDITDYYAARGDYDAAA